MRIPVFHLPNAIRRAWSSHDSSSELYLRKSALTVTRWPLIHSTVGICTDPADPFPLMPKKLLACAESPLRPQSDSSAAWAMVMDAGTFVARCDACAAGATSWMKALRKSPAATDSRVGGWLRVRS